MPRTHKCHALLLSRVLYAFFMPFFISKLLTWSSGFIFGVAKRVIHSKPDLCTEYFLESLYKLLSTDSLTYSVEFRAECAQIEAEMFVCIKYGHQTKRRQEEKTISISAYFIKR